MADNDNQPATKSDVHAVRGEVQAVRGELKADIQAVRGEVQAVRGELKAVEQRLDQKIDKVNRSLAIEIVKTQAEVREIKETMATKDDVSRIMNAIDKFSGYAKQYEWADASRGKALMEVEIKVEDHDHRLKALESARS